MPFSVVSTQSGNFGMGSLDTRFGAAVVDTFLPDDVVFLTGFHATAAIGTIGSPFAVIDTNTETFRGCAWAQARYGACNRATSYGFSAAQKSACMVLRGLKSSAPIAGKGFTYVYNANPNPHGTCTVAQAGVYGIIWSKFWNGSLNTNHSLTSVSHGTLPDVQLQVQGGLYVHTNTIQLAAGSYALTSLPAHAGGSSGDSWAGSALLALANIWTDLGSNSPMVL